jgi:hypothetical protein
MYVSLPLRFVDFVLTFSSQRFTMITTLLTTETSFRALNLTLASVNPCIALSGEYWSTAISPFDTSLALLSPQINTASIPPRNRKVGRQFAVAIGYDKAARWLMDITPAVLA